MRTSSRKAVKRRGVYSIELLLTLPMLLIVIMGAVELGMLLSGRAAVVEASRQAARKASLPNATDDEIQAAALGNLSTRMQAGASIQVHGGEKSGEEVTVSVQVPMLTASPDLLWPIGYSLSGRQLYAQTTYTKE